MSETKRLTTNEVIPFTNSDLFDLHPESKFAVGILAVGTSVYYPDENLAYHRLRANVYASQLRIIPEDRIEFDGGEYDADDARSAHFGVIENLGLTQRLVASMRIIIRGDTPLPVEEFFDEVFSGQTNPRSVEVSRYICRHEDSKTQDRLHWPLFSKALAFTMANDLSPAYAVIEEFLERKLRSRDIPFESLGSPKFVPEYITDNLPIVIDTEALGKKIESIMPGTVQSMQDEQQSFSYFGNV